MNSLSRLYLGLPWWLSGKESSCQCRRGRFNPWVRKIPEEGNGNPLQSSCLENSMDRGVQGATVHGVAKSRTQLTMHTQKKGKGAFQTERKIGVKDLKQY